MIFGHAVQHNVWAWTKISPKTIKGEKNPGVFCWQSIGECSDSAQGDFNRDLEHIFCFITVNIGKAALQWNKAQLDVNTETITLSP